MRLKKQISFLLTLLCCSVFTLNSALAQRTTVKVLEETASQITYELTAEWNQTLKTAIDSSGSQVLSVRSANAAVRGVFDASQTVSLSSSRLPRLNVVASDFDEVTLPLGPDADTLALELAGASAFLSDPGTFRKQPVISLNFRLLTYDASNNMLRRYRRIVARVTRGSGENVTNALNGPTLDRATALASNSQLAVQQSALSDGTIIKFPITREGIYRIDRTFLSEAGLNPDAIDPDKIQILGNGGAPLPALNSDPRPADLLENPVLVRGGGDGSFDDADVLLFYGAPPTGWNYDTDDAEWQHYVNPFSNQNFYFLKVAAEDGMRVAETPFPGYSDATQFSEVTGRLFVDFDLFNWSKQNGSGLTWVSNPVDPTGRLDVLTDSLPPGFAGGDVTYHGRVAIKSNPSAFARFNNAGTQLAQVRTGSVRSGQEEPSARLTETTFTETVGAGQGLNISLTLEQQPNSPEVALDWLRAYYPKSLSAQGGLIRFATPAGESGRMAFQLSGFGSTPQVWDITNPDAIQQLGVQASGNTFTVQLELASGARPREIIAFTEQAARSLDATSALPVTPQNLHGLTDAPDFIIVTPAIFKPYADELAAIRSGQGLTVRVTLIDEIFNEFAGGLTDMRAVRDYLRFVYDSAPTEAQRLKYVLF